MTEPFLPAGVDSLPARRFVLLADETNRVRAIDESRLDRVGTTVDAYWDSPTLNAGAQAREATLKWVHLSYSASSASEIALRASGDGGVTWSDATFQAVYTDIGLKRVAAGFNVSGYDLRFRVVFPQDEVVIIHEYNARILARSEYIIGP